MDTFKDINQDTRSSFNKFLHITIGLSQNYYREVCVCVQNNGIEPALSVFYTQLITMLDRYKSVTMTSTSRFLTTVRRQQFIPLFSKIKHILTKDVGRSQGDQHLKSCGSVM